MEEEEEEELLLLLLLDGAVVDEDDAAAVGAADAEEARGPPLPAALALALAAAPAPSSSDASPIIVRPSHLKYGTGFDAAAADDEEDDEATMGSGGEVARPSLCRCARSAATIASATTSSRFCASSTFALAASICMQCSHALVLDAPCAAADAEEACGRGPVRRGLDPARPPPPPPPPAAAAEVAALVPPSSADEDEDDMAGRRARGASAALQQ